MESPVVVVTRVVAEAAEHLDQIAQHSPDAATRTLASTAADVLRRYLDSL